jgi:ferredoxin
VELRIDREACQGHALCVMAAPELFDIGDDGIAFLLPGADAAGDDQLGAAQRAALNCPEDAIEVIA